MAQLKEAQPETAQRSVSSVSDIQSHRLRSSSNNRPKVEGRSFDNEVEPNEQEMFFQRDGTYGLPIRPVETNRPVFSRKPEVTTRPIIKKADSPSPLKGLKKRSLKKSKEQDMPPTPIGHDWHLTDGGWNLVKSWSEKKGLVGQKIKKERYSGYLSREAWQVMKEYEHEKIIAQIGQQSGRHSGR